MNGKYQRGQASCLVKRSVQVPAEMRDGLREISNLHTPIERRKNGDATELLAALCEEADTHGLVLMLHCKPFGDPELGASQLETWYAKFGFMAIQDEPRLLARMAGSTPRVLAANSVTLAVAEAIEAM